MLLFIKFSRFEMKLVRDIRKKILLVYFFHPGYGSGSKWSLMQASNWISITLSVPC